MDEGNEKKNELQASSTGGGLLAKESLMGMVKTVIDKNEEQSQRIETILEDIGELRTLGDVNFKGPTVSALINELGKTTDRLNNLLSVIQRFENNRVQADALKNGGSVISHAEKSAVYEIIKAAKFGPNRIVEQRNKKEELSLDDIKLGVEEKRAQAEEVSLKAESATRDTFVREETTPVITDDIIGDIESLFDDVNLEEDEDDEPAEETV